MHPPAPCGAGLWHGTMRCAKINFNPPAPCGAGRFIRSQPQEFCVISIHPPRAGRDDRGLGAEALGKQFQSTRPVRGGTLSKYILQPAKVFQSTRPVRGGTAIMHKIYPMHSCTIHNTTCSQTTIRIPTSAFLLIIRSPSACSPVFRCEPMGSPLRASTSHGQIIRTSSGL